MERGNLLTLMGRCGFYCGCCPDCVKGTCEGCVPAHREGDCFTRDCVEQRGLELCPRCPEFPCEGLFCRVHATVLDRDWLNWKRREREDGPPPAGR